MVDFKKINEYIEVVERSELPEGLNFNEFAVEFFRATQPIPLSKYLRKIEKTSKMPKLMNMKKAGEVLIQTEKDEEVLNFLKRRGYKEIPDFDYKSIMLLRKIELIDNWSKVLQFHQGKGTIQEINNSLKPKLLPIEVEKLEEFVKRELKLSERDFNWFITSLGKISENRELDRALKKLINNI